MPPAHRFTVPHDSPPRARGGSLGLSGLNRLVMGTTVAHVIRRARTSVPTVPGRCPADEVAE
jgi:hypothetical protein